MTGVSPASISHDRVAGTILGAAIGDAMGHPTEFLSLAKIKKKYPPSGVTGFELWWTRDGRTFAPYTDDTQMAEIVLRSLTAGPLTEPDMEAVMTSIAAGFVKWAAHPQGGHRAPGNACLSGAGKLAEGLHWSVAGGATAGGCGSVMRAFPFGLVFPSDREKAERWAVEHSKMTHRDPIALAACAAMAVGVSGMLTDLPVPSVFDLMVEAAGRYSAPTATMMLDALSDAAAGRQRDSVLDRLRGWAAHEAIAAAVYVAARHPFDIRAAILEGANSAGDSDSIATLAGALLGARLGLSALSQDWVRDVERSEELLDLSSEVHRILENAP